MALGAVVLWIHVLCGVVWVGTCASFVLAAWAIAAESSEWRAFAMRAAPPLNRINIVTACTIPLTGLGNLVYVGMTRSTPFPPAFFAVLSIKVFLYCVMGVMLAAAMGAETAMRTGFANGDSAGDAALRKMMRLYAWIAGAGTIALMLGLWLAGT
jgi:hypothetical protein